MRVSVSVRVLKTMKGTRFRGNTFILNWVSLGGCQGAVCKVRVTSCEAECKEDAI